MAYARTWWKPDRPRPSGQTFFQPEVYDSDPHMNTYLVPGIIFALCSGVVSLLLFDLYRKNIRGAGEGTSHARRWVDYWDLSPNAGAFSYWSLAFVSALGLFLELLLIRWVSSEVRIFAFFKNFVLIACFLGFGLGGSLCRHRINWLPFTTSLLTVVLLVKAPWEPMRSFIVVLPNLIGASSQVHIWGVPSLSDNEAPFMLLVIAGCVIAPFFALLTLVFVPLGQMVGWYLENAPNGIWAYSVNVLASLAGICLYTLLCLLGQPPSVWFAGTGIMATLLVWRKRHSRWLTFTTLGFCVILVLPHLPSGLREYWSPYQKVTLQAHQRANETILYSIFTNDSWHQRILNLTPAFAARHPDLFAGGSPELDAYNLPYRFRPAASTVLVLGAGTGNDVAAALRNGAGRVVAVEIDPLILRLGKELHFERPYDSPRVQPVLQDARSFIQNSHDRFDLILFSLLDSHTTSSHYTNIRIDNYVYTVEAMRAARRLLRTDGVFVIKFQVETPWIAGRLHGLMTAVFEKAPIEMRADQFQSTTSFFIHASESQLQAALSDTRFASHIKAQGTLTKEKARLTTDDWPYFYQREPGIPAVVIAISIILFLLCLWAVRETGLSVGNIQWHFFFLGAGFLLMEVQIISKMALLFGTTWIVNSIVISGLLLLIVASNFTVKRFPNIPIKPSYLALGTSLAFSCLIPLESLVLESALLKAFAATVVLCLPVFFAGMIFIRSFAAAGFQGSALGSNLLGSLMGGLLESFSYWTGLKSLLALAGICYVTSYVALNRPKLWAKQPWTRSAVES